MDDVICPECGHCAHEDEFDLNGEMSRCPSCDFIGPSHDFLYADEDADAYE